MSRRRWLALAVAGVALLLITGRLVASYWVDRAWYASLGADALWRSMVTHTLGINLAAWVVATAFVYANLYVVRRSVVSVVLPRRVGDLEIGEEVPAQVLSGTAALGAIVIGAALAIGAPSWLLFARARYGIAFGESDPAFGNDLGFYVHWLPFEEAAYTWSLICAAVVTALVLLLYALTPSLRWERGRLRVTGYVRKHVTILGAVVLALLAWNHRLDAFDLLVNGSGPEGAFTHADRHVNISTNLLLALLTFSAAVAVVVTGWLGQIRLAFGIVTVVLVASIALRAILPVVADRLAGAESPADREGPFRNTRAAYTRRAYAIDRVTRGQPPPVSSLADLSRRVPAWEAAALRQALERSGAGIIAGDFGWRGQGGVLHAVAIDAPGRVAESPVAEPWRVLDLSLTPAHASGELPPQPAAGERSERPLAPVHFYPGATGSLVIEDPDELVIGAQFSSFFARLAHAWSQQNFRLLRRDAPATLSQRMLLRRDVRERVGALVPAFLLGSVVTPIVSGDSVWWAVDIYSASPRYPLSEPIHVGGERVSYLRHAAVGLVHSHSGATVIVTDEEARLDPMARSWVARMPGIFRSRDSLPPELVEQLPRPLDAIHAQATEFARVGSRSDPAGGRRVPASGADSLVAVGQAPVSIAAIDAPPLLTYAVVDAEDRLRGVVAADVTGDRDPVWVPLEESNVRWAQAVARLRRWSDSASARGDARTVRGAVRVIPVNGRAVLVQTSYRWRSDTPPTIGAVAVLDRDVIVPLESVAASVTDSATFRLPPGLEGRFGGSVTRLYDRMRDALRRGDWRAFGVAYDSLGVVIRQYQRAP